MQGSEVLVRSWDLITGATGSYGRNEEGVQEARFTFRVIPLEDKGEPWTKVSKLVGPKRDMEGSK